MTVVVKVDISAAPYVPVVIVSVTEVKAAQPWQLTLQQYLSLFYFIDFKIFSNFSHYNVVVFFVFFLHEEIYSSLYYLKRLSKIVLSLKCVF